MNNTSGEDQDRSGVSGVTGASPKDDGGVRKGAGHTRLGGLAKLS
jgi:hypothetical protein